MPTWTKSRLEHHIKTHTERSADDIAAVDTLRSFLRSQGRIFTDFSSNDKWPNIDGRFEFVPDPSKSRNPKQNFFVQIKGTHSSDPKDASFKYSLKSLAFPAWILGEVSADPGILFVVVNGDTRGSERIFWKYMSPDFLGGIDANQESCTISFSDEEELFDTDESIDAFCSKLSKIADKHSFMRQLDKREFSRKDIFRIIALCDRDICEHIDRLDIYNETRDEVSQRILTRLEDFCRAALYLNAIEKGNYDSVNLRLAWEYALMSKETKYLSSFLFALKYIDRRIPDDGQSERLLLKYYEFLWQIRAWLKKVFHLDVLHNLEAFPLHIDPIDKEYQELVAAAVDSVCRSRNNVRPSRYYVRKCTPFFVGTECYYEITLQLAGKYATKYNRITAYSKHSINSDYSVQIGYAEAKMELWNEQTTVMIITDWKVSIDPACLNKLGKILGKSIRVSSRHGEYDALMNFLTQTGCGLLDLIDFKELQFIEIIEKIYRSTNTCAFKDILVFIRDTYSEKSQQRGRNVIRYLLLNMQEETIDGILPDSSGKQLCPELYITSRCVPFEKNPYISNLANKRTSEHMHLSQLMRVAGHQKLEIARPYLTIRNKINSTGELYYDAEEIATDDQIKSYNKDLDSWERGNGYQIKIEDGLAYIEEYETTTIQILQKLKALSAIGNEGQQSLNNLFLKQHKDTIGDNLKEDALKTVFVHSRVLMIYGAAGTGKTTLMNYISNLMGGHSKLFLAKTHTALQNLKRRINNPGPNHQFMSLDSYIRRKKPEQFSIIFVDECSIIDNRSMLQFIRLLPDNAFLVLAGDIHQIESIEFGNWFFYAKGIITAPGAQIELLSTWRTEDENLLSLWDEVRTRKELITEKLVIDGPFSEDLGPSIFNRVDPDEVVLCLNYDGKFGLNNMNAFFQNANSNSDCVIWQEWRFKAGDPILFIDTKRFPELYNNLKGRIVCIEKNETSIAFTVDAERILTMADCAGTELEYIDSFESSTRIRFTVYDFNAAPLEEGDEQSLETAKMRAVIPFQLAYAVSIHKAQGLEYNSVKVVIPSSNSEQITHGVFYTAITRSKQHLKIYWSSETMQEIVKSFYQEKSSQRSLEIVKTKLQ